LREFAAARDWDQFHSPKNLAMALAAEAGELLEVFQWLSEAQSRSLDAAAAAAASEEVADVLLYLIRLSDTLGIDLMAAAKRKLVANAEKYPIDKARGSSRKYTEL
jgi:dCTP diphosphatase